MMGLIADSGYERISTTLSVNSAQKFSNMTLLFVKSMFKIAFSSRPRTSIVKILLSVNSA